MGCMKSEVRHSGSARLPGRGEASGGGKGAARRVEKTWWGRRLGPRRCPAQVNVVRGLVDAPKKPASGAT